MIRYSTWSKPECLCSSRCEGDMRTSVLYKNYEKSFVRRGVAVARSVNCLATNWTTGRSRFDPRQRQGIFPLTSVSIPAVRPTQPPVQWVPRILFKGKARRDADHSPHLIPRSRMSRSHTSSPLWRLRGGGGTALFILVCFAFTEVPCSPFFICQVHKNRYPILFLHG
jgi:hypothetical protein